MPVDDGDDPLDDRSAELEARFRELEREAEIERLRRGGAPGQGAAPAQPQPPPSAGRDPLADMKAALDAEGAPGPAPRPPGAGSQADSSELYLLVLCPHCEAKNRMSLTRVRTASPVCGRCKQALAIPRGV